MKQPNIDFETIRTLKGVEKQRALEKWYQYLNKARENDRRILRNEYQRQRVAAIIAQG